MECKKREFPPGFDFGEQVAMAREKGMTREEFERKILEPAREKARSYVCNCPECSKFSTSDKEMFASLGIRYD